MSLSEAYDPDTRWGRAFGFKSTDYAGGWHRGQDIRKLDPTERFSVETDVVAISAGVVDYVGRPNDLLGPTVRIRRDDGGYEFHSHTIASVKVGDRVAPGDRLGRNARLSERPGFIFGIHDHVVFSAFADGAWNTSRKVIDPRPIILNALEGASPAGGGARPFPTPPPAPTIPLEADMATLIRTPTKGHFNVAPGVCLGLDPKFIAEVDYVAKQAGGPRPLILDVADSDRDRWVGLLSGCPASQLPKVGYAGFVWYAALNPTA